MNDSQKKQVVRVVLVGLIVVLGGVFFVRMITGAEPGTAASLTQDLTIRCSETGDEWTLSRGKLEQALYSRQGEIDVNEGLVNPETGKATGFPVNRKRDWDGTIDRIKEEKAALAARGRSRG